MDVHAPHESIHTWKDFWIHLGTIAIGLLIALGLEAGVEWVHHIHQRHQLEADMHAEGEKTVDALRVDLRFLDITMRSLLDEKQWVDAMAASHRRDLPMPASVTAQHVELAKLNYSNPTLAVWTTAEDSQLAALLPRQEAEMYARVYWQATSSLERFRTWEESREQVKAYEERFADRRTPTAAEVSRMSDAQMEVWSGLLAVEFERVITLRRFLEYLYGANDAMLRGVTSEQEMIESMYRARAAMPDEFGSGEMTAPVSRGMQGPQ